MGTEATLGKAQGDSEASNLVIAFDTLSMASGSRNQGIYVYTKQLLKYFREIATEYSVEIRPFFCAGMSNDANALEADHGFLPAPAPLMRFHKLWRIGGASVSAFVNNADLIFSPYGTLIPIKGLLPAVTTIHDITPVITPSYYPSSLRRARFFLRRSAWLSHAVITDSICSKRDLLETFHLPESKVSVVYLGYDKAIFNDDAADPEAQRSLFLKLGLKKPYIFHHGTIQPRKNLSRLIAAFRLLMSRNLNLDFDLVLAGALGWKYEDVLVAARGNSGNVARVVLPGALSDAEIALLLKGASLVVIPSLYEGFCLPMIESMACGAPTIAANTSCLPEVSGAVLKYFDPESTEDIADCMEDVLEDVTTQQQLSRQGRERALSFDWRRCARETLSVLTSFHR